jgi:murein DD-endopeptidase MepM/ murein hydrolase activator NlpD
MESERRDGYKAKPFVTILDEKPVRGPRKKFALSLPSLPSVGNVQKNLKRTAAGLLPFIASLKSAVTEKAGKIAGHQALPGFLIFGFIAVLSISAGAGVLIGVRQFPLSPGALVLPDEESVQDAMIAFLGPDQADPTDSGSSKLPPLPQSVSMKSYTVRTGDTVDRIAKRFSLRQDTVISANNLSSASSIRPGIVLRIPTLNGISHKVRSGDSLSSLSKRYGIEITQIVDANDLESGVLGVGQSLFIPNARLSAASISNFYGESFLWPARGSISSPFGYRANPFTGLKTYHSAIDIVVHSGTKVRATAAGTVADTGYNSVFGNYIILKHSGGYQSLYAHLSSIGVKEGAQVSQSAIIGLSGNTGQSTGPHLHFSIFKSGKALDPVRYVK